MLPYPFNDYSSEGVANKKQRSILYSDQDIFQLSSIAENGDPYDAVCAESQERGKKCGTVVNHLTCDNIIE